MDFIDIDHEYLGYNKDYKWWDGYVSGLSKAYQLIVKDLPDDTRKEIFAKIFSEMANGADERSKRPKPSLVNDLAAYSTLTELSLS